MEDKKETISQTLINQIISMIQNSHNKQDILDLMTFDIDQLNEILTEVKKQLTK